jgi:hypothetical protein
VTIQRLTMTRQDIVFGDWVAPVCEPSAINADGSQHIKQNHLPVCLEEVICQSQSSFAFCLSTVEAYGG